MSATCHLLSPSNRQALELAEVAEHIAQGQGLVWLELRDIDHPTLQRLFETKRQILKQRGWI